MRSPAAVTAAADGAALISTTAGVLPITRVLGREKPPPAATEPTGPGSVRPLAR